MTHRVRLGLSAFIAVWPYRLATVVLLAILVPAVAGADGLHWLEHEIVVEAGPLDTQAVVAFAFTNTGDEPVTIESIQSSCGCTTAALDKKTYAPGESGSITATFSFGDRVGQQIKRITVRTDDPRRPQQVLVLRVEIPQPVRLEPRALMWRGDEPRESKTMRIVLTDVPDAAIADVSTSNPRFDVALHEVPIPPAAETLAVTESAGGAGGAGVESPQQPSAAETAETAGVPHTREYDLVVTPPADHPARPTRTELASITIEVDFGGGIQRTTRAFARVVHPTGSQASNAVDTADPTDEHRRQREIARRQP